MRMQVGTGFKRNIRMHRENLIKESGKFRSGDVGVFDGDEVIHMGAHPEFVPELVDELFAWAKKSELHPLLKSGILHYEIETIHPFADGNGRMGRLWQTLMLSEWNEIFSWIPMEAVVYEKRPEYYQSIQTSRFANDSGAFIEYTLAALYASVLEQLHASNEPINEKEQQVLEYLRENPRSTKEQIATAIGQSRSSVTRHIQALIAKDVMRRMGSNKTGYWHIVSP